MAKRKQEYGNESISISDWKMASRRFLVPSRLYLPIAAKTLL